MYHSLYEYTTDPMLYDAGLTLVGEAQARRAALLVAKLSPEPELLVVSPLTRALQTADLAFGGLQIPNVVQPLAREQLLQASECGKPR